MWGYLGPSCLVGVALLLLFILFKALMGKLFSKVRFVYLIIENRIGVELATHIMCLFVTLSSIKTSAETLFSIGFIDNLCVSLQNTLVLIKMLLMIN